MTETMERPEVTAGTHRPNPAPPQYVGHAGAGQGAAAPPSGPGGPGGPVAHAATTDAPVSGFPAYGTLLQVLSDSGPPEVFTTIAGIGDITGPNTAMGEVETTSHSTGAPVRSYIPSLADPGEISAPCYWNPLDPTQSVSSPYGVEALFWGRTITKWQLITPDPSHRCRQFYGFVKTLGETYPVQGVMTRNIAVRITSPLADVASPIALTPASASPTASGAPTGTFDVGTGGSQAPWRALPGVPWITVSDPVDLTVGDASVTYAVAANSSGTARTGHINISGLGLTFTVTQAGS